MQITSIHCKHNNVILRQELCCNSLFMLFGEDVLCLNSYSAVNNLCFYKEGFPFFLLVLKTRCVNLLWYTLGLP